MVTDYMTPHRRAKEERDMAFYKDYMALTKPNRNATGEKVVDIDPIFDKLQAKYGIYARSTCYAIIKRVENKLNKKKTA